MNRVVCSLLGLMAISLAACDKPETPPPVQQVDTPAVVEPAPASEPAPTPSAASDVINSETSTTDHEIEDNKVWVNYGCDSGKQIRAAYDNDDEQRPSATLEIDGQVFSLYSIITASGAGYASEQGLRPDEGIKWLTKGDEAMLVAMILDHTANPDDAPILMRCRALTDGTDPDAED